MPTFVNAINQCIITPLFFAIIFFRPLFSRPTLEEPPRLLASSFPRLFLCWYWASFRFVSFLVTFFSGLIIFDVVLLSCLPTITRMPLILVEVEAPFMSRGSFLSPSSFPILSIGTHTQRLFYLVSWGGETLPSRKRNNTHLFDPHCNDGIDDLLYERLELDCRRFSLLFLSCSFSSSCSLFFFSDLVVVSCLNWAAFVLSQSCRVSLSSSLSISLFPSTRPTLQAEKLRFQLWSSIGFAGK